LQYRTGRGGIQHVFSRAPQPLIVAQAITHALTSERPKTRYLVGRDARIFALLAYLPDRARDVIVDTVGKLVYLRMKRQEARRKQQ
jgi:hypothetical protein